MSGGYINRNGLNTGEHLVITFTFKGPIPEPKCRKWDTQIVKLKALFGESMMGVTQAGENTPRKFILANTKSNPVKKKAAKK